MDLKQIAAASRSAVDGTAGTITHNLARYAAEARKKAKEVEPIDLFGSFEPPALRVGLAPELIERFALANGAQMGADPAGLAMAAITCCAAAIPDRIQVQVKRHDPTWRESARLWCALVGPPSAKKSPIISAASSPICRIDMEMMREWRENISEYEGLSAEEKKRKAKPAQKRLRIEDTTIEAAQGVLEGSPDGVLLLADELSGFFGSLDKYNGGKGAAADRAFWLRSFNGGEYALNRVQRGVAIIENLSISMLGGIQPEPLRRLANDSVDDGLLQRINPIILRVATIGRDEPMPPVNEEYRRLVERLHQLAPPGLHGCGTLEFSEDALALRRELEVKHVELMAMEAVNKKLASHIGKFDGMFARLCVTFHCIESVQNNEAELSPVISIKTAGRAARYLHSFLLPHAIAFYAGVLGLSDDHDRLAAVAGYILAKKLDRITNRDVSRGDSTMRRLRDHETRAIFEQLEALGWIDRTESPRAGAPPHWIVNPLVHVRFADRARTEEDRRARAKACIREVFTRYD